MLRGLIVIGSVVIFPIIFALLSPVPGDRAAATEPPGNERAALHPPRGGGRQTEPLAELTTGNASFALDLYQHLCTGNRNVLYSPYSISQALAMTYAGARNRTAQQMAGTLRFSLGQEELHPAFRALDLELRTRGEGARGRDGQAFKLHIANAIWSQEGFRFLDSFLDVLKENYGAGLRLVDFREGYEGARMTINNWVTDETEGKIKDLFPRGTLTEKTRLVLTNAIYFNATWLLPFKERNTRDDDFYLLDGQRVRVPMMSQTASFGYAEGSGVQAVELRYDGGEMSMIVLLPKAGRFKSFEESLHAKQVASILAGLDYAKVELTMPRFKYESQFGLNAALAKMGMPDAFLDCADFSGMTGKRDLKIDHVVHKAYILVDESGTEAAAATGVAMCEITSMQPKKPPIIVKVDRPFVYLIRDIKTGAILFVGRVMDPGRA
ncbi:MAG: serpin family protein [Phycisphaerae bacterium]|nr:serpin family protein [Phycisphaerae bacterium]